MAQARWFSLIMKQQTAINFFYRPSHTQTKASNSSHVKTQITASSTVSYLVYSRHHTIKRRHQLSSQVLPSLTSQDATKHIKTEVSHQEKTIVIKSHKGSLTRSMVESIQFVSNREEPLQREQATDKQTELPSEQPQKQEYPTSEVVIPTLELIDTQIFCETQFHQAIRSRGKIFRNQYRVNMTSPDEAPLQEKSQNLLRKVLQLITTNRDKADMSFESETTRRKHSKAFLKSDMDRAFSGAYISTIQDEKSPTGKEKFFQQQISVIPRGQTKITERINTQTMTYNHLAESLRPMKSLLEAMKEKHSEKDLKQEKVAPVYPRMQTQANNIQRRKVRIQVTGTDETPHQHLEFEMPSHMDDSGLQISQRSNNPVEQTTQDAKEQKQQNIYQMVSKSILQKKFASLMVSRFGNKILQKQSHDDPMDDMNSKKAQQFTRYYLQNKIIKSLSKTYSINKLGHNSENNLLFLFRQDSIPNDLNNAVIMAMNTFGTNRTEQSSNTPINKKLFMDSAQKYYKVGLSYDSHQSLPETPIESDDDCSIVVSGEVAGYKLFYIQCMSLCNPWRLRDRLLRPIISQIDDESKNLFLHQEIEDFPVRTEKLIASQKHISSDSIRIPSDSVLIQISDLFQNLVKSDRKAIIRKQYEKYDHILTGQFIDHYKTRVSTEQKHYIQMLLSQSIDESKVMSKSKNKETTHDTIPKDSKQQMVLSLPPPKVKSDSSSVGSDTRTRKAPRQRSERALQIKVQKSRARLQIHGNPNNLSIVKENKELNIPHQTLTQPTNATSNRKIDSPKDYMFKRQQSMDPFSLLFRNMIMTQTMEGEKTLTQRCLGIIEEHKILDLKEMLAHNNNLSVNTQDEEGNSLLIFAAKVGAPNIVHYLLSNGADMNHKNNEGKTAMQVALENYQFASADIINLYLKSPIDNHSLF